MRTTEKLPSFFRTAVLIRLLPTRRIASHEYVHYGHVMQVLFHNFYKTGHMILDAGCGKGHFLKTLPPGAFAVGVDLDSQCVSEAKTGGEGKTHLFVVGDLQSLPFRMETFNIVFCRDVLEHVKERKKVLDEMTAVLQRGGTMVISTSNLLNPAMLLDTATEQRKCEDS